MKNIVLLILIFSFNIITAQTPSWQWIKVGGANTSLTQNFLNYRTKQIGTDAMGNIYGIASVSSSGIAIDTLQAFNGYGYDDFVVFSYSCEGDFRWIKQFGSYHMDMPGGIISDKNGNIIISGGVLVSPNGDAHFGDSVIPATNNMQKGYFMAKLDSSGHLISLNLPGPDVYSTGVLPMRMEADNKGNPVVLTWFSDSTTWNGHHVDSRGHYLVKFDKSDLSLSSIVKLDFNFRSNYGANYQFMEFTIDNDNSTYLWTQIPDSIFINSDTISMIPNQQNTVSVLARFNSSGKTVWYSKISGFGNSDSSQVITGKPLIFNNKIFMSGNTQSYSGSNFMGIPINNPIAKYNHTYTSIFASFNKSSGLFIKVLNLKNKTNLYNSKINIYNNQLIAISGNDLVVMNQNDTIKPYYVGSGLSHYYPFIVSMDTALTHFNWGIATKTLQPNVSLTPNYLHIDHNNNIIIGGGLTGSITNTAGDTTNLVAAKENFCIAKIALTNDSCGCQLPEVNLKILNSFANKLMINAFVKYKFDSLCVFWGDGDSSKFLQSDTNISHQFSHSGPWNVCLKAYGYCGISDTCLNNLYSGINYENSFDLKVKAYPNPFNKSINIKLSRFVNNAEISVYDVLGKQIFQSHLSGNQSIINTSNFKNGVYYLQIKYGDFSEVVKIIKTY